MSEERRHVAGLIFVALMFIGAGIGLLFGRPDVGGCIGMGIGFIAMAFARVYEIRVRGRSIEIGGWFGFVILSAIGIALIAVGISLITLSEEALKQVAKYIAGAVSIVIGLVFIAGAFRIVHY